MGLITATLPQYANGNFFIQAQGSNFSESAGSLSTFGVFNAPVVAGLPYGITIIPPSGTSYSRFGATFVASTAAVQDITAILEAAIPPPFGNGGTVTNTEGPLTAGFLTMGNGGDDLVPSPIDYNVSQSGFLTTPPVLINGNEAAIVFIADSSSTSSTTLAMENDSNDTLYGFGLLGSASPQKGLAFEDLTTGAINIHCSSMDAAHPVTVTMPEGVIGWTTGSPKSTTADTALSRDSAGVVCIGNGTQGDASGGVKAAIVYGPAVKPTGSGPAGAWALSMDGFLSFCNGGTWQQMVPAV